MAFDQAREFARRVGEAASSALGEPLWLRDYPDTFDGDVGYVVMGLSRQGLHRVVGTVSDLSIGPSIVLAGERGDVPALVGIHGRKSKRHAVIAQKIVAYVQADGLDRVPLNALDAVFGLLDVFTQVIAVAGSRWRPTVWGEWEASTASGTSVEVRGDLEWQHFVQITQMRRGVSVRIPAAVMGGDGHCVEADSPQAFAGVCADLVDRAARALVGRQDFRNRPFALHHAGNRVRAALAAEKAAPGRFVLDWREGMGFPASYPDGVIWREDHIGQHVAVMLHESAAGVGLSADGHTVVVTNSEALDVELPAIVAAVRAHGARFTRDKLEPGRIYEITDDITRYGTVLPRGTRLRFREAFHVRYDGFAIYRFDGMDPDAAPIELRDIDPVDEALLKQIHAWLTLAGKGEQP